MGFWVFWVVEKFTDAGALCQSGVSRTGGYRSLQGKEREVIFMDFSSWSLSQGNRGFDSVLSNPRFLHNTCACVFCDVYRSSY